MLLRDLLPNKPLPRLRSRRRCLAPARLPTAAEVHHLELQPQHAADATLRFGVRSPREVQDSLGTDPGLLRSALQRRSKDLQATAKLPPSALPKQQRHRLILIKWVARSPINVDGALGELQQRLAASAESRRGCALPCRLPGGRQGRRRPRQAWREEDADGVPPWPAALPPRHGAHRSHGGCGGDTGDVGSDAGRRFRGTAGDGLQSVIVLPVRRLSRARSNTGYRGTLGEAPPPLTVSPGALGDNAVNGSGRNAV
mmetsp:Transcript_32792/g.94065  ORF Transcript_32792/g.94065 Transcript_32792/m.94065 type:complete len:256 (-) Transcript_32792:322-1089(-)